MSRLEDAECLPGSCKAELFADGAVRLLETIETLRAVRDALLEKLRALPSDAEILALRLELETERAERKRSDAALRAMILDRAAVLADLRGAAETSRSEVGPSATLAIRWAFRQAADRLEHPTCTTPDPACECPSCSLAREPSR